PREQAPASQRARLPAATRAAKPSTTATQMRGTMGEHSRPTRAEATDVHVAVIEPTGAVMLSEETAVGKYPVEAVAAMNAIAAAAERQQHLYGRWRPRRALARDATEPAAQGGCEGAVEPGA